MAQAIHGLLCVQNKLLQMHPGIIAGVVSGGGGGTAVPILSYRAGLFLHLHKLLLCRGERVVECCPLATNHPSTP